VALEADQLKLSPEVAWYLDDRGIALPTCPPLIKTPEPSGLPDAQFDPDRVDRVLNVFKMLRHTQGDWAGRPLTPDPWQIAYIIAPTYGWVRQVEGRTLRIVRTQYVEVPRKNGKTTMAGGQATYLTAADGEAAAQVYAVAAAKDQARYCFDPVKALAEKSPALAAYSKVTRDRIVHVPTSSYFTVVSSVADLLHGANIYAAVIDELHVHKTRALVEAVETGTGARSQPLILIITTADDGRQATVYAEKRDYVERVARGSIIDPTFYGVVWAAHDDDDPFSEETWERANPGYGISPTRAFMSATAAKARQSPATLASFKRLHLGIRTRQESRWIDMPAWDANASIVNATSLHGKRCFGGLDLASTSDLCAVAYVFPDSNGAHDVLWRHWLPEESLRTLDERTAGQANVWARQGLIELTPGNVTDYGYIRRAIAADHEHYDIAEIAYDPWNASQLVNDLQSDGVNLVTHRQGYASMSSPTKELLRLVLEGTAQRPRLRHGGNQLMRWQIDNFAVEMDAAGNVKPSKRHAGDKIDGVVALIMALDRAARRTPKLRSAYENRGVTVA